jgi:serine protease inhibitor
MVNAVYFLGKWADPFSKHATRMDPFQPTADGPKIEVAFLA